MMDGVFVTLIMKSGWIFQDLVPKENGEAPKTIDKDGKTFELTKVITRETMENGTWPLRWIEEKDYNYTEVI